MLGTSLIPDEGITTSVPDLHDLFIHVLFRLGTLARRDFHHIGVGGHLGIGQIDIGTQYPGAGPRSHRQCPDVFDVDIRVVGDALLLDKVLIRIPAQGIQILPLSSKRETRDEGQTGHHQC